MSTPSNLPLSKVRVSNGLAFVSGEVPIAPDGSVPEGISAQTKLTLERIASTLRPLGMDLNSLVSLSVYLTNVEDFAAFNEAYAKQFAVPFPARVTACAGLMVPGARIEISGIAEVRLDPNS